MTVKAENFRPQAQICPLSTRELAFKVLEFCQQFNDIEFFAYQKQLSYRVIESLLSNDGATITGLFSRQSGKSETLADTGIGIAVILPKLAALWPDDERLQLFRGGVRIGIFAPKQQLAGPIYLKMRDRVHSERGVAVLSDREINVAVVQSRGDAMAFTNGSIVRAHTASESTITEGETYHLCLLDEAQRISQQKVSKEIQPMLSSVNGTMAKIGTAWSARGGFHTDIQQNIDVERKGGKKNHFEFPYDVVIKERRAFYNRQLKEYEEGKRDRVPSKYPLYYEKWVNTEIARLGGNLDSEEFKMNFRLLWQESRQIAIRETLLDELKAPHLEINVPRQFGFQVAGLDIAKDNDCTVLTILDVDLDHPIIDVAAMPYRDVNAPMTMHPQTPYYNKRILAWLELQGSFENVQYDAIVQFLMMFNVKRLIADSTGMGDPVVERLHVLLIGAQVEVVPFRHTMASKSDMWKLYLQELNAKRITYPAGPVTVDTLEYQKFRRENLALERTYNGPYLVCSAPEGEHDDYPNSTAMAVWGAKDIQEEVPEVEVIHGMRGTGVEGTRMPAPSGGFGGSRANRYLRRW